MGAVIRSEGKTIDYTPGSNVSSGDVVVQSNLVGVAAVDIDSGDQGALTVEGIVEMPKATGTAISAGDVVFWDDSANNIVTGAADAGNIYCGHAVADAASGATVIDVKLDHLQDDEWSDDAIADPGDGNAIPVTGSGYVPLVTGGAETRTLADPTFIGQRLLLYFKTDAGDCVITAATGVNQTGNTQITFADAGDAMELVAIESGANKVWRVVHNDGGALA